MVTRERYGKRNTKDEEGREERREKRREEQEV